MSDIVSRWRGRLATRRRLEARARRHHQLVHTAVSRALLSKRKAQTALAERVIARHLRDAEPVVERAAKFIASWEGGQSRDGLFHPYFDHYGGVWTIGYGHTGGVSARSRPLTQAQAEALLAYDLSKKYAPPVLALKLPTYGMQVALISAVYNLGPGILAPSHTLGAALRRRDWKAAGNALLLYDKDAHGQRLDGLTRRREAERNMFLSH